MGTNLIKQTIDVVPELNNIITERYAIGKSKLAKLQDFVNKGIWDGVSFQFNNPYELIISIRAYPFWMSQFFATIGASQKFAIGKFKADEVNVEGCKLSNQRNHISLGTYTFNRRFNNYLDFAPYTKIDMYLPAGFGFVSLNVNEVMGKTIDVQASMDFDNGTMQIFIVVDDVVIQTFSNKIGADITLTKTNNTELSRNTYLSVMSTLLGTGGAMMGANSNLDTANNQAVRVGGTGAIGLYRALEHQVHGGTISEGRNQFVAPTSIYMIIQRPNPVPIDNNYLKVKGKPLGEYRTLSTLSGFTIIEDVHLTGFIDATDDEVNQIDTLLKSGVHL